MGIIYESEVRSRVLRTVAEKMLTAARTAPKAKGIDNLVISIAEGDTIKLIAEKMKELTRESKAPDYFVRDADNILLAEMVVLLGTRISPIGIKFCGLCGYKDCAEKSNYPNHPCAINAGDLGIAIGSAVSVAMDERVDNRVMHSIGMAVRELGLLDGDVKIIYGIPLSIAAKNPFFDRK
jgi:uncharacterized ferredoxin-like protein